MSDIKPLNLTTKTLALMSWLSLGLPSTVHRAWISGSNEVLSYRVGRCVCIHRDAYCTALSRSMRWQLKTYSTRKCKMSTLFSGHYLRNRSTLDIGVLGYSVYFNIRNTLPKSGTFLLGHPVYVCVCVCVCVCCSSTKVQTSEVG